MKHGVVVASPRAGITRDKYSANKSSHHPSPPSPSRTVRALVPFPLPLPLPPVIPFPRVIYKTSRGGGLRGRRQFLTSRAVYRRWPPASMPGGGRGGGGDSGQGHIRCIRRAFYFVPRARTYARALFLSLSCSLFFLRFPFFALVLRYRSIFFAFFGRRWIARQLPIRII